MFFWVEASDDNLETMAAPITSKLHHDVAIGEVTQRDPLRLP